MPTSFSQLRSAQRRLSLPSSTLLGTPALFMLRLLRRGDAKCVERTSLTSVCTVRCVLLALSPQIAYKVRNAPRSCLSLVCWYWRTLARRMAFLPDRQQLFWQRLPWASCQLNLCYSHCPTLEQTQATSIDIKQTAGNSPN